MSVRQSTGPVFECPLTEHIFESLEPVTDPSNDIDQVSFAQRTQGELCIVIVVFDE